MANKTIDGVIVSATDVVWWPTDLDRPAAGGMEIFADSDGAGSFIHECYSSWRAARAAQEHVALTPNTEGK